MAQPYLDQLSDLVTKIVHDHANLACKHFFSGAALYANGKICASLTPKGLAFKLPPEQCDQLISSGRAIPLRYFDRSPVKQGYILLPDYQTLTDDDIAPFFTTSISYVSVVQTD